MVTEYQILMIVVNYMRRVDTKDSALTLTFKAGIEGSNNDNDAKRRIEVYTYNNAVKALSEFKPNF